MAMADEPAIEVIILVRLLSEFWPVFTLYAFTLRARDTFSQADIAVKRAQEEVRLKTM